MGSWSVDATTAAAAAASEGASGSSGADALAKEFVGTKFSFDYPASFVLAFDRTQLTDTGILVSAADYVKYRTFSVEREKAPVPAVNPEGLDGEALADLLIGNKKNAASTLRFQLQSFRSRMGPGGSQFWDFDYVLETCRGEIQEGSGGVLRCLGGYGQEVRTLVRRHLTTATIKGNYLYIGDASASEEEWAEVLPLFTAMVCSLAI